MGGLRKCLICRVLLVAPWYITASPPLHVLVNVNVPIPEMHRSASSCSFGYGYVYVQVHEHGRNTPKDFGGRAPCTSTGEITDWPGFGPRGAAKAL